MPTIPDAPYSGAPFEVGETLTVYEAAMVYSGRHPGGTFLSGETKDPGCNFGRASLKDYEIFLGRNARGNDENALKRKLAWDIYCEVLQRIGTGKIEPIKCAYQQNGALDPRDTLIKTSDLARLASERRERPEYLALLLDSPETHTGFPGRPQKARELCRIELEARASRGELEPTLKKEAQALLDCLKRQYPTVAHPTPKTIENNIREVYRQLKATK